MGNTIKFQRWDDLARERMNEKIDRRFVTGERTMLAQVFLAKGAIVPRHQHESEQVIYILEGALRLWIGDERAEHVVRAGEVLVIPGNVPHEAEALEDTLDLDVFSPPRQDWLDGTDDYFGRA